MREDTKFLIRASYLEIYNEQVRDLLSANVNARLDIREDPDRGVYVKDLTLHESIDTAGIIKMMAKGTANRSVGATAMNSDSSRSHSIFTVWVEMYSTNADGTESIKAGKLNLVDLAGSERQSKTQAEGARLKEATKINLSLSALGNVISALVDGKSKHIPYRDSKLTRLLQDSLGGNTKTLMIAAISPADNNYDETLSTLRYANRAKNIKNKAKINEDPKDALLREYQEEIKKLKAMLAGDGVDLEALQAAAAAAAAPPKRARRSLTPVEPDEALIARMQAEKEAELAAVEKRLKTEYDAKIAKLQEKLADPNVDHAQLEAEFAEVTKEYQTTKAQAEEEIIGGDDMPPGSPRPNLDRTESGTIQASASQVPVTVLGPDGNPIISLLGPDGTYIKATTGADNQLRPVLEGNNQHVQVLGPDGAPAVELGATAGKSSSAAPGGGDGGGQATAAPPPNMVIRFVPTTVIGPGGEPVAALVGPDGQPIQATVNGAGQLEPMYDATGQFMYVQGPEGESASKAHTVDEPVQVVGPDGDLEIAVMSAAGTPLKAEVGFDGVLQPVLDAKGRAKPVLGPDGKRAREAVAVEPILESESFAAISVVIGPDGAPAVAATVDGDGYLAATEVQRNALTVSMNPSSGRIAVKGPDGASAKPIFAANEAVFVADPGNADNKTGMIVAVAGDNGQFFPALSPELGKLAPAHGAGPIANPQIVSAVSMMGPGGFDELLTPAVVVGKGGGTKPAMKTGDGQIIQCQLNSDGHMVPVMSKGSYKGFKLKSHHREHVADARSTAVVMPDGSAAAALFVVDLGQTVAATVDAAGRLAPVLDGSGNPKVLAGTEAPFAKLGTVAVVPKLTAVIGPDGKPVPAILSPDGHPVEARVTAGGQIQAVRDRDGNLKVILGPNGKDATEVSKTELHVVATADNQAIVAVKGPDGEFVKAGVGDDGMVSGDMDASGWPTSLPSVTEVKGTAAVEQQAHPQVEHQVIIVTSDDGQAVPAIVAADGTRLRTQVGPDGKLMPMADPDTGSYIALDNITAEASVDVLQPIHEEAEPGSNSEIPSVAIQSEVDAKVAERLRELEKKFAISTAGAGTPAEQKTKAELKEELLRKKSRAERKRLERLRKAAVSEDDQLLEEIYERATDKLEGERQKFRKAKELLKASRAETKDLAVEFETERQALNDNLRDQQKHIMFMEAVMAKVMPVMRRDCNYYNMDKIRREAQWDEETQSWLMPALTVAERQNLASLSGAPGMGGNGRDEFHGAFEDDRSDVKLRARLAGTQDSQYFERGKGNASDRLLGNINNRHEQIAAQMESRLARINRGGGGNVSLLSQRWLFIFFPRFRFSDYFPFPTTCSPPSPGFFTRDLGNHIPGTIMRLQQ